MLSENGLYSHADLCAFFEQEMYGSPSANFGFVGAVIWLKRIVMNKNDIIEPDNEQGRFEKALRMLQEKLKDFHCPICHAEEGITLYDEPYFVMHYDWDKNTDKPWKISTTGFGRTSVLGVCNNCGYSMLFNVCKLTGRYNLFTVTKESVHIKKVVELIERRKRTKDKSSK